MEWGLEMASTFRETSTNYCSDAGMMSVTSNERRWINKLLRLATANPSDVRVVASPESNDGYICCHLPSGWLKISPPRKMTLTDEQRAAARARLAQSR